MEKLRIADRIFNTPLLIHPQKVNMILVAIGDRLFDGERFEPVVIQDSHDLHDDGRPGIVHEIEGEYLHRDREAFSGRFGSYSRDLGLYIEGGVAIIDVVGTLVHKGKWVGSYSGLTSYEGILEQRARALEASAVNAIMWNFHTFGGELAGCFDAADVIFEGRGGKPEIALVADAAASAGYALASACEKVYITQAGLAGSIGVRMLHADYSERLKAEGIKITEFATGKFKTLGTPYRELSEADIAKLQAEIDKVGAQFHELAARNRGTTAAAIKALEADTFDPEGARAAGLVDGVMSGADLLSAMQKDYSSATIILQPSITAEGQAMDPKKTPEDQPEAGAAAAAELTAAKAAEFERGRKAGAADERKRISTILGSDEAQGREALARHLAFSTDQSAEVAEQTLAAAGKDKPGLLGKAMDQEEQPDIDAEPGKATGSGEQAEVKRISAQILNAGKPAQPKRSATA